MHISPKTLLGLVLSSFLLLFSACLDIEQKLVINADGSGSLHIRYIFDEEALEEFQEFIDPEDELFTENELLGMIDTTAVSLTSLTESRKNGLRTVDIIYSFKDITVLSARWCDDHNYVFLDQFTEYAMLSWSYAAGEEPKEEPKNVINELEDLFTDHYCRFTIEVPYEITEADESAAISQDRHTAHWQFPMLSFMRGDTLLIKAKLLNP